MGKVVHDDEAKAAAVREFEEKRGRRGALTLQEVADKHGMSLSTLGRALAAARGVVRPNKKRTKPTNRRLTPDEDKAIAEYVLAHPEVSMGDTALHFREILGFPVRGPSIRGALHRCGVSKRKVRKRAVALRPRVRSGYNDSHRRVPEAPAHRRAYPSDYTDREWSFLGDIWAEECLNPPVKHSLREMLNAVRYIVAAGCPWRLLPHDFPPHSTVFLWFQELSRDGTIERVNAKTRRLLRRRMGREDTPSFLIIDTQTAASKVGGQRVSYDAGKKTNGRKRHIAVDTEGFAWSLKVQPGGLQDRHGVSEVIPTSIKETCPRLQVVLADGGYSGLEFGAEFQNRTGVKLRIARRLLDSAWAKEGSEPQVRKGFHVIPFRWIVERSFGWYGRRRRVANDYERTVRNSTAVYQMSIGHIYAARAAQAP